MTCMFIINDVGDTRHGSGQAYTQTTTARSIRHAESKSEHKHCLLVIHADPEVNAQLTKIYDTHSIKNKVTLGSPSARA